MDDRKKFALIYSVANSELDRLQYYPSVGLAKAWLVTTASKVTAWELIEEATDQVVDSGSRRQD